MVLDPRDAASPACMFMPDAEFEEVQCPPWGSRWWVIGAMQAAEALKLMSGCTSDDGRL